MNPAASRPLSLLLFAIARWISLAVAAVALVAAVISLVFVLGTFGSGSLKVPKFADEAVQESAEVMWLSRATNNKDSVRIQTEKVEITNRYGKQIVDVIARFNLTGTKTDDIVEFMRRNVPEAQRDDYIAGWPVFLKDGLAVLQAADAKPNPKAPDSLTEIYGHQFERALSRLEVEQQAKAAGRYGLLGIAGGALCLFVLALIVPVLVSIERNTRQARSGEHAAPVRAAAKTCPQCGAPISAGDTFCGGCGASLA